MTPTADSTVTTSLAAAIAEDRADSSARRIEEGPGGSLRVRVYYRCILCQKPPCSEQQSSYPDETPLRMCWIWRNSPLFHELLNARGALERVHHHDRTRFRVGLDNHHLRRARVSMPWNQFCAEGALLITWLMIHWLQGWLDGTRRLGDELATYDAKEQLERLVERRAELRLDRPNPTFVKNRATYEQGRKRRTKRGNGSL